MKRSLLYFLAFVLSGSVLITGCSSEQDWDMDLASKIAFDPLLGDALSETGEILNLSMENDWQSKNEEIGAVVRKISTGVYDDSDLEQAEEVLGISYDAYISQLSEFSASFERLTEKYPQLNDMTETERKELFTEVYELNPELVNQFSNSFADYLRACPLRDLCFGIVDIAKLIGGPILCEAIAGAVPIIGPFLCNIVLDLAENLLDGICGLIPC